jgi:hypothetical protein
MAQLPRTSRSFLYGAALFCAGSLAGWHIRSTGLETGILRFGGRNLEVISRSVEPGRFEAWVIFFTVAAVAFAAFAALCLALSWHLRPRKTS